MKYLLISFVICLCLIGVYSISRPPRDAYKNPQGLASPSVSDPPHSTAVWGFIPYWNLSLFDPNHLTHLTDLAYFGISVDQNGAIVTKDLGYRRFLNSYSTLQTLAQKHHLTLHLVIRGGSDQDIFTFLHSDAAQARFFQSLEELQTTYPVQGYNLDFEPAKATDSATTNRFTHFMNSFQREFPQSILSVDVYPSAASSLKLWHLPDLEKSVAYFIIMAYDYTSLASLVVGPVAPVFPSPLSQHSLMTNLAEFSRFLPPQKLIVGLPLYGYQWDTLSPDAYASVLPHSGQLATYKRLSPLLTLAPTPPLKDRRTLTSRLLQKSDSHFTQTYFEDLNTFQAKVNFIHHSQYAGLALWALGYEGQFNIWESLESITPPKPL